MDGKDLSQLRIALIHFWLTGMRGGERVLESFCRMFPKADIYTHVVRPEALSQTLLAHPIHTTFIQKLPGSIKHYQKYLPLMPLALEQLDLHGYDLVISSESGPAKGIITRADTPHICYCHSPMRYLWNSYQDYLESTGPVTRFLMRPLFHRLRLWDYASAQRVDHIIANSRAVQRRVKRWWGVSPPSSIHPWMSPPSRTRICHSSKMYWGNLYPEAITSGWGCSSVTSGWISRYKPALRLDGTSLFPETARSGKNWRRWLAQRFALWDVCLTKRFPHSMRGCKAFLFPGEEDFGITPLEASAAGRPVIAYGKGGVLGSIIPDETGLFFEQQSIDSLIAALGDFEAAEDAVWSADRLKAHAQSFSEVLFRERMGAYIQKVIEEHRS